jgi:hypothetical protein
MSGGQAVKAGRGERGITRSAQAAGAEDRGTPRVRPFRGSALTARGPQAPKQDERSQRRNGAVHIARGQFDALKQMRSLPGAALEAAGSGDRRSGVPGGPARADARNERSGTEDALAQPSTKGTGGAPREGSKPDGRNPARGSVYESPIRLCRARPDSNVAILFSTVLAFKYSSVGKWG